MKNNIHKLSLVSIISILLLAFMISYIAAINLAAFANPVRVSVVSKYTRDCAYFVTVIGIFLTFVTYLMSHIIKSMRGGVRYALWSSSGAKRIVLIFVIALPTWILLGTIILHREAIAYHVYGDDQLIQQKAIEYNKPESSIWIIPYLGEKSMLYVRKDQTEDVLKELQSLGLKVEEL